MSERKPRNTSYGDFLPKIRAFARESSGSLALYGALFITTAAGLAGLGMDMSIWYAMKRDVQGIADAASVGAAYAVLENQTDIGDTITQTEFDAIVDAAALSEATRNGYDSDTGNSIAVVTMNTDEGSGVTRLAEVTVRQVAPLYFASLFIDAVTIEAFAGAGNQLAGTQCILALDPTADAAVSFTGSGTANVGCGVMSNSTSDESVLISGASTITANPIQAHGEVAIQGGATLPAETITQHYVPTADDPYADAVFPTPYNPGETTCDSAGIAVTGNGTTVTITPGAGVYRICGNVSVNTNNTLVLGPGNYEIGGSVSVSGTATIGDGNVNVEGSMSVATNRSLTLGDGNYHIEGDLAVSGDLTMGNGEYVIYGTDSNTEFSVGASGTVDGSAGVLIYLTGDAPTHIAKVSMNGGAEVTLAAYDTSSMPGVIMAQDPTAAESYGGGGDEDNSIVGGTTGSFTGSFYFPSQEITFSGNTTATDGCIQIVARLVEMTGDSTINNDPTACNDLGIVTGADGALIQVILVQ